MKDIVVSVPHSGTRTLMSRLGLDHYEHFNREINLPVRAHIPVRHPHAVARSWAKRDKRGGADRLVRMYSHMFEYMDKHVVISVPHSGSRTLMERTNIRASDNGLLGAGDWWHFGNPNWYGKLLKKYKPKCHIPIRHPHDVARSWASRHKEGNPIGNMVNCYNDMFDYLEDHDAVLYRIEDSPVLAGTGEHKEGDHSERIQEFIAAVDEKVIAPHREFFAQYYEDLR